MPRHADTRSVVRRRTALALGAGGAAVALAAAPAALAAGASASGSATPTATDVPTAPRTVSSAPKVPAAETTTITTSPAPIVGDFGSQKIRVGVDVDPGPYSIPAGVTTTGSEITITETAQDGSDDSPAPCDTSDPDTTPGSTTTYCPGIFGDTYVLPAGDTAVITQTDTVDGLVIDKHSITIGPCTEPIDSPRSAKVAADLPECDNNTQDAIFTDGVPVPTAVDDQATTGIGQPVTIPVLANDSSPDEPVTLTLASEPEHGTATVQNGAEPGRRVNAAAAAGTATVLYTPAAGFSGTDHFKYTITNRFTAPSTATVTVTIPAAATSTPASSSAVPSSTSPSSSSSPASASSSPESTSTAPPIASTGTPTGSLLGYGLLLVAAGGAITVAGTRRVARGRHAR